jgi:hypothetical protein
MSFENEGKLKGVDKHFTHRENVSEKELEQLHYIFTW